MEGNDVKFCTKKAFVWLVVLSLSLDPDCTTGTVPRDYPLVANNQCSNSFYRCDANRQRSVVTCGLTLTGSYFGINSLTNTWQCINGLPSFTCPSKECFFELSRDLFVAAWLLKAVCFRTKLWTSIWIVKNCFNATSSCVSPSRARRPPYQQPLKIVKRLLRLLARATNKVISFVAIVRRKVVIAKISSKFHEEYMYQVLELYHNLKYTIF